MENNAEPGQTPSYVLLTPDIKLGESPGLCSTKDKDILFRAADEMKSSQFAVQQLQLCPVAIIYYTSYCTVHFLPSVS